MIAYDVLIAFETFHSWNLGKVVHTVMPLMGICLLNSEAGVSFLLFDHLIAGNS